MNETNISIQNILGFTVGYYGSILQVTGNVTYAQEKTNSYIYSGLTNLAYSHLDWSPSFKVEKIGIETKWFVPTSWSIGNITMTYTLPKSGLEGIKYSTTSLLQVKMIGTINNHSIVNVRTNGNLLTSP